MNRVWIVIVVLLSVNLTISDPVKADSALKDVKIFKGINPARPRETPHTIPRRYVWSFEGKYYTAIMGIDQKRYSSYLSRRSRNPRNLSQMVAEGTDALQDLVREFKKIIPRNWTDEERVNFVLAFVQHLPYVPDKVATKHDEFFRYTLETLVERGGDCEDTSVLSASILNGMGFELVLIWPEGHIAIGVKGNFSGYYYPYKKNAYYFCETTGIGWKLGALPPDIPKYAQIIPITPKTVPAEPERAMPVAPRQPVSPRPDLSAIALVKGINLFETELEFEKAIKSFTYALDQDDLDSEQRALAHLYWGCSELGRTNQREPNYNYYVDKAEKQFSKVFRHNPNQELPPRLRSKRKIRTIFEQVRKKSIGVLTVSSSLPQTETWIDGNEINRKMLGTGTISLKLFKGTYTVEGIYKGRSIKETVKITPNFHERLEIKIPPSFVDDSPPRIVLLDSFQTAKVNQRIALKVKVTDDTSIRSVYLFYGFAQSKNSRPLVYRRKEFAKSYSNTYTGYIQSPSEAGYIWYYLTATDGEGKEGKTEKRVLEIKSSREDTPKIVLLDSGQTAEVNQHITIRAQVIGDTFIKNIHLFYGFSRSGSEPLVYNRKRHTKSYSTKSVRYTGSIPAQSEVGYIWYYLTATDTKENQNQSEKRVLEIIKVEPPDKPIQIDPPNIPKEPARKPSLSFVVSESQPPMHEGVWANHTWLGNVFEDGASIFDWSRGNTLNLAYLREGKTHQTFGAQLDFSYQNSTNASATLQWGPALGKSPIVFTFLGGIAGYRNSGSNRFETIRTSPASTRNVSDESIYITPILGASLKLYPLDRLTIDATGSLKLPSVFDTTYLYHYKVGVRIYITRPLNLKIGYGQWYIGNRNITRIQIGLGFTF